MNDKAKLIKLAIEQELAKEGKTLQDLEVGLSKEAVVGMVDLKGIGGGLKTLGAGAFSLALGTGMLGGTGLYAAYLQNQDSTEKKLKFLKEKQQYDEATRQIRETLAHPNIM